MIVAGGRLQTGAGPHVRRARRVFQTVRIALRMEKKTNKIKSIKTNVFIFFSLLLLFVVFFLLCPEQYKIRSRRRRSVRRDLYFERARRGDDNQVGRVYKSMTITYIRTHTHAHTHTLSVCAAYVKLVER